VRYGQRPRWRRLLLIICSALFIYITVNMYNQVHNGEEALRNSLETFILDLNFTLAQGNNSATEIFDPTIHAYYAATVNEFMAMLVSASLVVSGTLVDLFLWSSPRMLLLSVGLCVLGFFGASCSVLTLTIPDYVRVSGVANVLPTCAPKFNASLLWATKTLVQLGVSILLQIKILPILVVFPPNLVRVLALDSCGTIDHPINKGRLIFVTCVATIVVVSFPLAIVHHAAEDKIVTYLIAVLMITPLVIGVMSLSGKVSTSLLCMVWLTSYYFYWIGIITRLVMVNSDIWPLIRNFILNGQFISSIFLEVILSTVVLTDLMIHTTQQRRVVARDE